MPAAWMIGATIQAAGEAALTDNDAWVQAKSKVAWPHLYIEGNPIVKYTGEQYFDGWAGMVGIPICITEVQNGEDATVTCFTPG